MSRTVAVIGGGADYPADGTLTTRTRQGRVPVTGLLDVEGHDHRGADLLTGRFAEKFGTTA